jgi:hypothetical protein
MAAEVVALIGAVKAAAGADRHRHLRRRSGRAPRSARGLRALEGGPRGLAHGIHRDVYSDYIREADSVMGILRPEDEEEPSGNGDVAVTDIGKPAET